MTRTKLKDRILPHYTRGEEIGNTLSHAIGIAFGLVVLISCLAISISKNDPWSVVGSAIYGISMLILYTASTLYHGIQNTTLKKVLQVVDHCTIYLLIGGTYTPILFSAIRQIYPTWCWVIFAFVWGLAVIGTVFTAIDLKKYAKFSMVCYLLMGWCILLSGKIAYDAISLSGMLWLHAGGVAYTIGAVLYGLGKKRRYMHFAFHLLALLGSILHYVCIIGYIL